MAKKKGAKEAPPKQAQPPAGGRGKLRERALGPAADEFGKELAPLGKEVGGVSLKVGRMLLRPIEGLVGGLDRIGTWLGAAVTKRLKNVPEEKIVAPSVRIAVPAVQALVYSMDDEVIREMFANLLASDMNADTKASAHPAFIEIIKEMTSQDAKVMMSLATCIRPPVELNARHGTEEMSVSTGFDYSFRPDGMTGDECHISLDNIERLGLARRTPNSVSIVPALESRPDFISVEEMARKFEEAVREGFFGGISKKDRAKLFGEGRKIFVRHVGVDITRFGSIFLEVCLP